MKKDSKELEQHEKPLTVRERTKIILYILSGTIGFITVTITFAWLPYWWVTGKNLYTLILK